MTQCVYAVPCLFLSRVLIHGTSTAIKIQNCSITTKVTSSTSSPSNTMPLLPSLLSGCHSSVFHLENRVISSLCPPRV